VERSRHLTRSRAPIAGTKQSGLRSARSADFLESTSATAREAGCLHHQFAVGDGFVLIVDEWTSAEAFTSFFDNPQIAEAMAASGAQGEPEITIGEAVDSSDRF
jgi:quinol monooxygenase YgiN